VAGADEIRASRQHHRSSLLLQCVEDYLAGARHPLSLLATDLGDRHRARLRPNPAPAPVAGGRG
jgi:hypothetical protein